MDMATAREQFLNHLQKNNRSPATILAYGKDIEQLQHFLALHQKKEPTQIKSADIETFLKNLAAKKYTGKSISRKLNSYKSFFRFLRSKGLIKENPAQPIPHPKTSSGLPRCLSPLEYRALRDAARADRRSSAIIEILLQTGIRISELAALRLIDIDIKKTQLNLRAQNNRPTRTVPLNRAALAAINRYRQHRPKTKAEALLVTKNGRPLLVRNIRSSVSRYFRLAGIKNATVNDLRNTFIVFHLRQGTALTTVSQLVGHKGESSTKKFLKLIQSQPAATPRLKLKEL